MLSKINVVLLILSMVLCSCLAADQNKKPDIKAECITSTQSISQMSSAQLKQLILNQLDSCNYSCLYLIADSLTANDFDTHLLKSMIFIRVDSLQRARDELALPDSALNNTCREDIILLLKTMINSAEEERDARNDLADSYIREYADSGITSFCEALQNKDSAAGFIVEIE